MPSHRASTLEALRQTVARIEAAAAARPFGRVLPLGIPEIDQRLGGGLRFGAVHELAPALPVHAGAMTGFALALAVLAGGPVLWIENDGNRRESGRLDGLGLSLYGLPLDRLVVLAAARGRDVLWAMEEALRSRAVRLVIGELSQEVSADDGMASRRLSLTAREAGSLGLLLRPKPALAPSAAATRWLVAAHPGVPDRFGGLGRARFALTLTRNRRGPGGRFILSWNQHDRVFQPALPVGVAAPAFDRPDRAPLVRTA